MDARWPLPQFVDHLATVIAGLGLHQDNGQVADAPNARAVRFYQSVGLLSRPTLVGRVAHYGPRHLQQVVAVKRLQHQGQALTAIQGALAGQDDDAVAAIAAIPAALFPVEPPAAETAAPAPARRAFWAAEAPEAAPRVVVAPPAPAAADAALRTVIVDDQSGATVILPAGRTLTPAQHRELTATLRRLLAPDKP